MGLVTTLQTVNDCSRFGIYRLQRKKNTRTRAHVVYCRCDYINRSFKPRFCNLYDALGKENYMCLKKQSFIDMKLFRTGL